MQNNDNKFDLDLQFGQGIESRLQKILAYDSSQDEIEFAFLFQVNKLKKYIHSKEHLVSYGGDDNQSKLIIIPIQDVHEILTL